MATACLQDRAVVAVSGTEARAYLDRLVTCSLDRVAPGTAGYGALLTPQGKIISDFVILQGSTTDGDETFLLDGPSAGSAELVKRLALYRLRARIAIADRSDALAVVAGWDGAPMPGEAGAAAPDPRLPALGWRAVVPRGWIPPDRVDEAEYQGRRIGLGVPAAGRDFALGDAFPHEALLDQLGGVDFGKGCYVGQEVVSRMQHRGTARTRIVPVVFDGDAPPSGTEVMAGERSMGRIGSTSGRRGLALLRLDRVADAVAAGDRLAAGAVGLTLSRPDWVRFPVPDGRTAPAA